MAQAEVVTVRMSRGNIDTPWGFDILPPAQISNVIGGSLADRAGLLTGDTLVELEGYNKPDYQFAKQLLAKAEHKIELVVHREIGHSARLWKPTVTENTEFSRFQHSVHNVSTSDGQHTNVPPPPPPPPASNVPVKVSLEHQPQAGLNIPGFNVKAQPYGVRQEVKHLQYNSPMPLYSPQSAAEQYLQQTGGLFGTDPHVAKMTEVPAYLRSETLRLIQEDEARKEMSKEMVHPITVETTQQDTSHPEPTITSVPLCYICGRNIQGVMCRAFDHSMHPECFRCATCGSSLKNVGHHFINGKFYCGIHGRQFDTRSTLTAPSLHPDLAVRISPTASNPKRTQEGVRAFYQPDIMARRPLSISPTPWKTQSPISPSNRGVPHSAVQYGQDLRNETYTSPPLTTSSIGKDGEELRTFDLTKHAPLPEQIHSATSPRRRPSARQWPPKAPAIRKFWRYENKIPQTTIEKVVSLTSYIKELDRNRQRPPSPKRHLLRGDSKKSVQPYMPHNKQIREINELPSRTVSRNSTLQSEKSQQNYEPLESTSRTDKTIKNIADDIVTKQEVHKNDPVDAYSEKITAYPESINRSLLTFASSLFVTTSENKEPWTNTADILEEGDLATEKSFVQHNDEDECGSLPSFDKDTTEFLEKGACYFCDDEGTETTIDEERSNHESEGEYEVQKIEQIMNSQCEESHQQEQEYQVLTIANHDGINTEQKRKIPSDNEKELWMKEEIEEAKRESEQDAKLEMEHLKELRLYGVNTEDENRTMVKPRVPQRATKTPRSVIAKQRSFEAEQQRMEDIRRIEEIRELNIARLEAQCKKYEAVWHDEAGKGLTPCQNDVEITRAGATSNKGTKKLDEQREKEVERKKSERSQKFENLRREEMRRQDENDKRLAIESIERHQRQLQEQQVQLSQLLDNAIVFLKNLDTEILKRSPEPSVREKVEEMEQYDNVKKEDERQKRQAETIAQNFATVAKVENSNSHEELGLLDFDTPSARIIRAIQELDSINNNIFSSRQERHTFKSGDNVRGRGTLEAQGSRIPYCEQCRGPIRGAYVLANGMAYCPDHFVCANKACNRKLLEIGFVEEKGQKYCEHCFETLIAPHCAKCDRPIVADCLNALQKQWHPECFLCTHCQRPFGNSAFFLEQGQPYCEADWNALFTTRCIACNYPIEAGDRWVEALGSAFHSNCFNCTACNVNLEGESFYAKNGAPYCKLHA